MKIELLTFEDVELMARGVVLETKLLTDRDMSKLLQVTRATLSNWRFNRTGPKYIKLGFKRMSAVRYRPRDVLLWLDNDAP